MGVANYHSSQHITTTAMVAMATITALSDDSFIINDVLVSMATGDGCIVMATALEDGRHDVTSRTESCTSSATETAMMEGGVEGGEREGSGVEGKKGEGRGGEGEGGEVTLPTHYIVFSKASDSDWNHFPHQSVLTWNQNLRMDLDSVPCTHHTSTYT